MDEQADDTVLMDRYRAGETAAFEELYARHRAPLYRFLLHQCRGEAADVFQEVWSRVIRSRGRYEVRASFRTYLYRIAHHCVADHFRTRGRKRLDRMETVDGLEDSLVTPAHEQPDAQASQVQLEDAFRRALAELPEEQLNVFLLFEESGLGLKEIAEVTGVPAETVKSRLRYALARLRRGLAPGFGAADLAPASVQP